MKKIGCKVIEDLLPLYVDGVASDESKQIIEEHLENCENCRQTASAMGKTLVIAPDTEDSGIKGLRKKLSRKKSLTICITSVITLLVAVGFGFWFTYYGNLVNYDDVEVRVAFLKKDNSYLNQEWVINFENKSGKPMTVIRKYNSGENGDEIVLYVREVPVDWFETSTGFTFGFSYGSDTPDSPAPPESFDQSVTVVYKDRTEMYSMRAIGLYEKQQTIEKLD